MKPLARIAACCLPALLLIGCGTYRAYRLPVSPRQAHSMRPALVSVAQQMGYWTQDSDLAVVVKVDDLSTLRYEVQNDAYNMVVNVDDKQVPKDQLESKIAAVKSIGDQIWAKAIEVRRDNSPFPSAAPPPPYPG